MAIIHGVESLTEKAGARHSNTDMKLLSRLSELMTEADQLLKQLGYVTASEEVQEIMQEVEGGDAEDPAEDSAESDPSEEKALSLDQFVDGVRASWFDQFYKEGPPQEYPSCVGVYETYVITRRGLNHYRVNFTNVDGKVVFEDREKWQLVEPDWMMKSAPTWIETLDDQHSVKALGGNRLGMYLTLWGSENVKDLTEEWFSPQTKGMLDIFNAIGKVPCLYHHGADPELKGVPIGFYDTMVPDEVGLWAEAQITIANKYTETVRRLAQHGYLGASSGTLPRARKVDPKTGEIKEWTIVEGSVTPAPADWRQRQQMPVQVLKSIYESCDLSWPELPNETEADEESAKANDGALATAKEKEALELELLEMELVMCEE